MANFDAIKTAIDANINTNGKQEITGGKMNYILHQMVDATDEQLTELESQIGTQKGLSTDIDIDNLPNGIVSFTATSVPSGMPNIPYGAGAMVVTIRKNKTTLTDFDRQYIITSEYVCTRPASGGNWANWENTHITNNQLGKSTDIDIDNLPNGIVSFTATSVPSGLPDADYGAGAMIFTLRQNDRVLMDFDRQFLITKKMSATRPASGGNWLSWEMYPLEDNIEFLQKGLSTDIDIDNLPNGIVSFTATSVPSGMPDIPYGAGAMVVTIRKNETTLTNFDRQYIITSEYVCTRPASGGKWANWENTQIKDTQLGLISEIDIDNLPNGMVSFTARSTPNGLPVADYGAGAMIFTSRHTTLQNYDRQYLFTKKLIAMRPWYNGSWLGWEHFLSQTPITCGVGKDYERLRDAIAKGVTYGSEVVVYPGIYDLTEEFAEELANQSGSGILLDNGVRVKFLPGSYVTCEVDVTNEWAYTYFEPFHAGMGDFTIDGLHIRSKNTRYSVHDEGSGQGQYHHRYINCHMEHHDENPLAYYTQCIGGGMGENSYIEIIGGYYKSSSLYFQSHYQSPDDMQQPISFHNGNNVNCDGKIVIKDAYLADKGYVRIGMYGSSTIVTPVFISGCRMYKEPFLMSETWNDSQNKNMEIIAWNNEIVA